MIDLEGEHNLSTIICVEFLCLTKFDYSEMQLWWSSAYKHLVEMHPKFPGPSYRKETKSR